MKIHANKEPGNCNHCIFRQEVSKYLNLEDYCSLNMKRTSRINMEEDCPLEKRRIKEHEV